MKEKNKSVKNEKRIRIIVIYVFVFMMCIGMSSSLEKKEARAATIPTIEYEGHVQDIGWMPCVHNGQTAGTTGKAYRLEAIRIILNDTTGASGVRYRVHVSNIGWMSWKNSGEIAGTTDQALAIEAIQIKLTGDYTKEYEVFYRTHVEDYGWTDWAMNGTVCGSTGMALRMEAIEIKLLPKGTNISKNGVTALAKPVLSMKGHVQDTDWMAVVSEGATCGTIGKGLRLEDCVINLKDFAGNNGIYYRAHVSNIGWKQWCQSGESCGTTNQAKAIEAVELKLSDSIAVYYDIFYRLHCKNYGWLGWAKNGQTAGTVGGGVQAEAIEVKLVRKGYPAPEESGTAYYDLSEQATTNTVVSRFQYPMKNAYICGNDWHTYYSSRPSRPYHVGMDIASSTGDSTVYAMADGTVAKVGYNSANGNYVILEHSLDGKRIYSFYAHLNGYSVAKGNSITAGQKIGIMGNTGSSSTGAHLHLAVVDTFWSGSYYGYVPYFSGDKVTYGGVTYYNPAYIVEYNRLP